MTKEITVLEAINYAIEEGFEQANKQLEFWNKHSRLMKNNAKSLETTLLQLHETVEFKGYGKRGKVYLGKKREQVADRIDGRENNQYHYPTGFSIPISKRPMYDKEFKKFLLEKYNTKRYSPTMVLEQYGHLEERVLFYAEDSNKPTVYRFLNSDGEIIYIGLTSEINSRMYQHFNSGHLSDEAYDKVETIEYIEISNKMIMNILETYLINKYQPKHNTVLKYDADEFEAIDCLDKLDTGWKKHRYERREQKDE